MYSYYNNHNYIHTLIKIFIQYIKEIEWRNDSENIIYDWRCLFRISDIDNNHDLLPVLETCTGSRSPNHHIGTRFTQQSQTGHVK